MQSPSSCDAKAIATSVFSAGGQTASLSTPIRFTGCDKLAFAPKLALRLTGKRQTTTGKLVNTFENVPDAPVSSFNLNINGGSIGILAVTRTRKGKINLCAGRHVAEADLDGHNSRQQALDISMKTPCSKRQTKAAKRATKRAAQAKH